jgi:putative flippase GtrA
MKFRGREVHVPLKFVRYVAVGLTAYAAEMTALYAMKHIGRHGDVQAVAVSFWVGLIVAFVLQKMLVFQNYDRSVRSLSRQAVLYGLLVAWNYGFTLMVVHGLSRHISVFLLRTGVIGIVMGWNFLLYHYIFQQKRDAVI